MFLKTEQKSSVFVWKRISVDGALVNNKNVSDRCTKYLFFHLAPHAVWNRQRFIFFPWQRFFNNVNNFMLHNLKKKHDWIKTFRGQCGQHWTKPGNPRKTFEIFGIQFFNHFEGELSKLICSFGQYHILNPLWSFLIFFLFFSDLYWQTGRRVYFAVYSE